MKLVLLVGDEQSVVKENKNIIPQEYTVLESSTELELLQVLKNTATGIVLVDLTLQDSLSWVEKAHKLRPELSYIGVTREELRHSISSLYYDYLCPPFTALKVKSLLERAWERSQLLFELNSLKENSTQSAFVPAGNNGHSLPGLKQNVLYDFAKSMANNFNREKLLDLFMDAVTELVPVGKISILLLNEETGLYTVYVQRGLDPSFYDRLSFTPSQGLMAWFLKEGRILLYSAEDRSSAAEALQEMELIQASASIPLIAHGQLMGSLNLGPKVTGSLFYEEELELLYFLGGNLAMALRDIELHHQVKSQKSYIESILQRMTGGVIAINTREEISTFNPRAAEILSLPQEEVVGKDLRLLPSPLGDRLYETFLTGKNYYREEIKLPRDKIPLEVTTYRLTNGKEEILGSVMIFDDISERKQLEAERRRSDKIEVLNKFVGQLAHEIKNPMVAIQTFSELLQEKYEDSSFREFFTSTVRQELKRLNELVEKLIAFSTPLTYNFTEADIHEIIDTAFLLLRDQGKTEKIVLKTNYYEKPLHVKADKTILARGFSYILSELIQSLGAEGSINIETLPDNYFDSGGVRVCFKDKESKNGGSIAEDIFEIFDPLAVNEADYITLGLPVSRKIIEDHGGIIKASLSDKKRFKFEVLLPNFTGEGWENNE